MKSPKIENAAFFEDVRNEINGKQILLGVTAPEITVGQVPSVVALGIWIAVQPLDLGPFEEEFRVVTAISRR